MVKKIRLDIKPFDDIRIIGINTSMMDYQLASFLNKTLGFSFVKYDNIVFKNNEFSFYLYDKGENSNTYCLVSLSSCEGKEWVQFKPKTDFLLTIRNNISDSDFNQILEKIKMIPKVFHAYNIDLEHNNKIDIILEYIELHESDIIEKINKRF